MPFHHGARLLVAGLVLVSAPSAAQNPPPPPPNVASPHATDNSPAGDSAPVTLSGCLERSKPQASASDASAAGPQAPYALRAAALPGREAVVYQLFPASDAIKLAEHVGHRIQITAVIRAATNSQPGLTNEGVSPSTRAAGMETMPRPKAEPAAQAPGLSVAQPLFVNAVKMLDVTCEAATR